MENQFKGLIIGFAMLFFYCSRKLGQGLDRYVYIFMCAGNRIFNRCGQDPKQLCVPCEEGTFTTEPRVYSCSRCSDCTGAQVVKKACTSTSDTVCGCQDGLQCGDATCSFCVTTCGKGEEPVQRSCRPCANGTFNDKIHEKCKPWRTR
uniref:TNFR-Cys domain-containing protein n=1 Tax=Myripristis murdjan TaxID=586833 RepID=A0A668A0A9_9TELE